MAEMWDISHYVEGHPDDYEQRWRLAKKLYMAWEYRLALEHLQILRNEWDHRVNVVRYLAATYYRLGRYTEAIKELESALETWPEEVGLHEQLARVREISGDREGAAEVWEKVAAMDPHHPIARKSAARLREKIRESANDDLHLTDSDDGIDLSPGQVCPSCGAQNSDEFDHCWQCHAVLPLVNGDVRPKERPVAALSSEPFLKPETVGLVGGLTAVALLSLGLYLSFMLVFERDDASTGTIHTLWDLYATEMIPTRLIAGGVMVLLWPLVLWLTMVFFGIPRNLPNSWVGLTGLLLAVLTYLCSWVPGPGFLLVFMVPAVLSLIIIAALFYLPFIRALAVWATQLVVMLMILLTTVILSESIQLGQVFNPIAEVPAVIRYALEEGRILNPGIHELSGEIIEDSLGKRWTSRPLRFQSTGSRWMDCRAGDAQFTVTLAGTDGETRFELADGTGTQIYELIDELPWSIDYVVDTAETYTIYVHDPPSSTLTVTAATLLRED